MDWNYPLGPIQDALRSVFGRWFSYHLACSVGIEIAGSIRSGVLVAPWAAFASVLQQAFISIWFGWGSLIWFSIFVFCTIYVATETSCIWLIIPLAWSAYDFYRLGLTF